jgi:hypothetical protein
MNWNREDWMHFWIGLSTFLHLVAVGVWLLWDILVLMMIDIVKGIKWLRDWFTRYVAVRSYRIDWARSPDIADEFIH